MTLISLKALKHRGNLNKGLRWWPEGNYGDHPALGDARWTPDLIMAGWEMAGTGKPPVAVINHQTGASEGGFDRLTFKEGTQKKKGIIDLSLRLNRREPRLDQMRIGLPWYGGGMSYGSVSDQVMAARALAAKSHKTLTCTGEGGYPPSMIPYADHVITQVATGLFGVSEETIQRAPILEFKYAQGAKPGLGGHLLGDKSTSEVAKMRESVPWVSLFSPFPFHSVYSVEDHRKHIDWLRTVNPDALISVKVSTPSDVDMVAVGSYYAGAHIVHLDGSYGGTGAAPEIAKKNIAMPIELAIPKVHKHLKKEGIRDEITLIASGGIRSAMDIAKSIALGADGVVLGTLDLIALGCTRCSNCERGRGCTFGLTTTDPELSLLVREEWGAERISNLYKALATQLENLLRSHGLSSISELRGRIDLLRYQGGSL
ncbi:alpha-hydroxy-acid oxidizing protein [bacterium]|nr:alpha-hydroxy-acid oxidizing protein [bacterium]